MRKGVGLGMVERSEGGVGIECKRIEKDLGGRNE